MDKNLSVSNWIWLNDQEHVDKEKPCIVYFRKEFHNADKLRISANCRYKLYINGQFVQEGPQKGTAEAAFVDPALIAEYIGNGRNVAAVEVLYYPEDNAHRNDSLYYSPYPCFYIEDMSAGAELDGKYGWKYYVADHIQLTKEPFDPAPIHGAEIVKGCKILVGWKENGYDDSFWQEARPYTFFESNKPIAPFHMEERAIPPMEHRKCSFRDVVCVRESGVQARERVMEQWNSLIKGVGCVEIPANTTQIVELSAGEEMCGYPVLSVSGGCNARIEILYSECYGIPQPGIVTPMGECLAPPLKGDRSDYINGCLQGPVDIYQTVGYGTEKKPEIYIPFLFRTFRYVQIKITTMEQGITILGYDYISTGYPLEIKTHLTVSDESMNKVWDISVRSLQRCMHETYVDCPFYEQLQYTMDSRAEILFTYSLAADDRLARQCMESFRRTQRSDGILQASAPAVGVNVIPGFSTFYILMLHDHMMYFGNKTLIREHFGCVDRILEYFNSHLTDKGLVGSVGGVLFQHKYWSFIDWCEEWNDTIGVPLAATMGEKSITMESLLYLYGLKHASDLADYIGRDGVASEYRNRAKELEAAIRKYCIGKDGLIQDGPGLDLYSTHCQVWAILNDIVENKQGKSNLERTFGKKGIPQCSVSMSFYLLLALKKVGWLEKADEMWDMWRSMVENNMTTCVENFTDQRSDCHAWGALILYALPAVYLGIRPTKPGFAEYEQNPDYGHLKWIKGEVVTPVGMITV